MITFSLTSEQAAYVVVSLQMAMDNPSGLTERDRAAMASIICELCVPTRLSTEIKDTQQEKSTIPNIRKTTWGKRGAIVYSGTRFRFCYKGTPYEGVVADGLWVFGKKKFRSPNRMLKHLFPRTGTGKVAVINSWYFIEVQIPHSKEWVKLHALREHVDSRK